MTSIVVGATGMVGGFITAHLLRENERVVAVSRFSPPPDGAEWSKSDIAKPETINLPKAERLYCTADARLLPNALLKLFRSEPRRVLVISSSSIFTKLDSEDEEERKSIAELVQAERSIVRACEANGVEWTILRPTLIYMEGRDRNVTQIAKLVRRLRFMPLYGAADGLRQPVHAEDLALGAISAARSGKAANMSYCTSGIETITFREMVGRIFDGLTLRRRFLPLHPRLWETAFAAAKPFYPGVTVAMGRRMMKDLAFDSSAAKSDFGWTTRPFAPLFEGSR